MFRRIAYIAATVLVLAWAPLYASVFGTVKAIVHDPQHRPVKDAQVVVQSRSSSLKLTGSTNDEGIATILNAPVGEYDVSVVAKGFGAMQQTATVTSGNVQELHFALALASVQETVEVSAAAETVNPASSTSEGLVNRAEIAQTPGVDRTNSLSMITDFVPGAVMVHDQLHVRGGHQITWAIDGVPVPNTNIASNVGPQFDPKDIDYVEVQRGSYSAESGDRTYGVFNVVTRSGFERNRQAELVASYGNYNFTDNQLSFGDHNERFAYYGSLSGYRTDLGLETPVPGVINDQAAGLSGFASLIFNKDAADQLRLVASARGDHYQVPINPADPLHDVEEERDQFVNFS